MGVHFVNKAYCSGRLICPVAIYTIPEEYDLSLLIGQCAAKTWLLQRLTNGTTRDLLEAGLNITEISAEDLYEVVNNFTLTGKVTLPTEAHREEDLEEDLVLPPEAYDQNGRLIFEDQYGIPGIPVTEEELDFTPKKTPQPYHEDCEEASEAEEVDFEVTEAAEKGPVENEISEDLEVNEVNEVTETDRGNEPIKAADPHEEVIKIELTDKLTDELTEKTVPDPDPDPDPDEGTIKRSLKKAHGGDGHGWPFVMKAGVSCSEKATLGDAVWAIMIFLVDWKKRKKKDLFYWKENTKEGQKEPILCI
ncbi:hypothetical protein FMUND_3055 [Fusarium mundagurra]|uniref:Uncharacterized protein n=1 Tax=Fusarium mundagurra TaxID=1567541 RepID=A0A8H5Z0D8_9HYPO|nr:hypothetical protein FMUND_3055 [Fusarium mundagurra]